MKKVLMLAALVLGAGCFAENLLINSDMKTDKGWVMWGSCPKAAADKAKVITYVNEGPNGERVLKFQDLWTDVSPYLYQQVKLPANADKLNYTLSFKIKAAKGMKLSAGVQIYCETKVNGKSTYKAAKGNGTNLAFTGTGDWKEYTLKMSKFSAGMNYMAVVIYPFQKADNAITGSFLVKDIVLDAAK